MKTYIRILLGLCLAIATFTGCKDNKTKSYSERLKDEKKVIQKFLDENDFVVINSFPKDSIFKNNQLLKLDNGVYINVLDYGDKTKKATKMKSVVFSRFHAQVLSKDTIIVDNLTKSGTNPVMFKYGVGAMQQISLINQNLLDQFYCEALEYPLEFVGHGAKVRMIIPFNSFNVSSDLYQMYNPVYLETISYKLEK